MQCAGQVDVADCLSHAARTALVEPKPLHIGGSGQSKYRPGKKLGKGKADPTDGEGVSSLVRMLREQAEEDRKHAAALAKAALVEAERVRNLKAAEEKLERDARALEKKAERDAAIAEAAKEREHQLAMANVCAEKCSQQ